MNAKEKFLRNNAIAFSIIENSLKKNKLSHAYIFSSNKEYIINAEPHYLIQRILNKDDHFNIFHYSDLVHIDGSKGLITKDEVISAMLQLQQTPLDEIGIKILFIENIENGNDQSINALLKFLEEPTKNTFIIMTTNNIFNVLSTIKSRCQIINLKNLSHENFISELLEQGVKASRTKVLSQLTNDVQKAIEINNDENFTKTIKQILDILHTLLKQKFKIYTDLSPLIKKDNYKLTLAILSVFYNDLWKYSKLLEVTFDKRKSTIENYLNEEFDYEKALMIISDFIVSQNFNTNFDLNKNSFLIKLEQCYG